MSFQIWNHSVYVKPICWDWMPIEAANSDILLKKLNWSRLFYDTDFIACAMQKHINCTVFSFNILWCFFDPRIFILNAFFIGMLILCLSNL